MRIIVTSAAALLALGLAGPAALAQSNDAQTGSAQDGTAPASDNTPTEGMGQPGMQDQPDGAGGGQGGPVAGHHGMGIGGHHGVSGGMSGAHGGRYGMGSHHAGRGGMSGHHGGGRYGKGMHHGRDGAGPTLKIKSEGRGMEIEFECNASMEECLEAIDRVYGAARAARESQPGKE